MDRREAILERLTDVAGTVQGIVGAYRNRDEVSDDDRPAIIILDADEEASDAAFERGRPSRQRNLVTMNPEIYIILGARPAQVGTEINTLRARLVKAVLLDGDLIALAGTNGEIRYEGCATALARGRQMEGEMGVSISFTYPLDPQKLTE